MSKNLWQSPTVVPEIAYDDVPAAIEFLTRAFGLRAAMFWGAVLDHR